MMPSRIYLATFLVLAAFSCFAQKQDSIALPVPDLQLENTKKNRAHSPKQALIWAAIPGGGQVYNRRWWKVPIVYGGVASMIAVLDYNQSNYKRLQEAYELKLADQPHSFSGTIYDNAERLRVLRNNFDRNRQTSYVGLFIVYALQGIEAYVDAHLKEFDVSDDLSHKNWQIRPSIMRPSPLSLPRPVVTFFLEF